MTTSPFIPCTSSPDTGSASIPATTLTGAALLDDAAAEVSVDQRHTGSPDGPRRVDARRVQRQILIRQWPVGRQLVSPQVLPVALGEPVDE